MVCDEVVEVLWVGSLAHAESEITAATTRQGMMNLFMGVVLVWIIKGQPTVGPLWILGYGV